MYRPISINITMLIDLEIYRMTKPGLPTSFSFRDKDPKVGKITLVCHLYTFDAL